MGTTYSPQIVNSELVAYFDAGNSKSYIGSGTIWKSLIDSSDEFNVTALTYNSDNGGALNMDAGNETTSFTPNVELANILANGNFTIETIVRSDNVVYPRSRHPMYIGSDASASTEIGWVCGHTDTISSMQIGSANGVSTQLAEVGTNIIQESTPYYRAFTVDRSNGVTTDYYENSEHLGVASLTNITGPIYNGGGIVFGSVQGWRFIGNLYIIKIYSKKLSTQEVKQNFEALRGRFGI